MTIPFAFIISLSVATTHISAIKGQGVRPTIEQEKEAKVPAQNYKSIHMLEKTDLHNKTISSLA